MDGNSFTLTQNGQTTVPIVRGANNTTAGISNALAGGNEQQQVLLTGNDRDGDSFTLTYNGNTTAPLIRGTNYTNNAAGQTNVQRALQGATEVQTVSLVSFNADGDSYTLTYNGNTAPSVIVRGQNNTTAGIQNAIMGGNEQQQITLTGFNAATQSFRVKIGANKSALIGSGGLALNNANLGGCDQRDPGLRGHGHRGQRREHRLHAHVRGRQCEHGRSGGRDRRLHLARLGASLPGLQSREREGRRPDGRLACRRNRHGRRSRRHAATR